MGRMGVGAWDDLEPSWRRAFDLAWDSYAAGSPGVGAVVAASTGTLVSEGRSRRYEHQAPTGRLAGNRLAHAEINALIQLSGADDDLRGHTLHTTLEPCLGCMGAIRMSLIGTVEYAAPDPMWSQGNRLLAENAELFRRWPRVVGPLSGTLSVFGFVLPLIHALERRPGGRPVWRKALPATYRLGERLHASGEVRRMADAGMEMPEVLERIGPDLGSVAEIDSGRHV